MAVDRDHIWLTVHNTTESCNSRRLQKPPRLFVVQRSHHMNASEITDYYLVRLTLLRTTSTEQCARAATAAEILPNTNLSKRLLKPAEPTKIQSAFHSSAALQSSCFGSPSLSTHVTLIPARRNMSRDCFEIFSTQARSSCRSSSSILPSGGITFPKNSGANGSSTITTLTSLCGGQQRAATALSASSLAGEPSVPTMILTGEPGSSTRP